MIKGELKLTLSKEAVQEIIAKWVSEQTGKEVDPKSVAFQMNSQSYALSYATVVSIFTEKPIEKPVIIKNNIEI